MLFADEIWLADKLIAAIGTEAELAPQALKVALQKANKKYDKLRANRNTD